MTVIEKNGIRILTIETEHLDALNSEELKKQLIDNAKDAKKVILNLEKIIFIDSSGLGVILTVFRHIKEQNGKMVLCSVKDSVKILFKLVRLSHMIQIFDSQSEALEQI
ncbi:MAG: STAS domain-containing protein [Spirochaetaceae bacterium]|nr:STAS domain-containing protein [Spirochaetaceae bacterium]